jgi:hypothetical protein
VKIIGIEDLTTDQIHREIANGGKFVFYQYCVSAVLVTFKRTSNIYFLRGGQHSAVHGLPFTLISLVAGWWGIPWGPIYTVQSVWTNITGGRDVTPEMLAQQTSSPAIVTDRHKSAGNDRRNGASFREPKRASQRGWSGWD